MSKARRIKKSTKQRADLEKLRSSIADIGKFADQAAIAISRMASAFMPLSWATRKEIRGPSGAIDGITMEPHFADCPNWPRRRKKA